MADVTPSAYPLQWPPGFPRTPPGRRRSPQFRHYKAEITFFAARERLQRELDRINAKLPVVSMSLQLRLDGTPRRDRPDPADPGVAVYFRRNAAAIVLPCDTYTTVAGNLAAVAAHIEALRAIERHGVGTLDRMFTGFVALPAPIVPDDWRSALGNPRTLAEAEAAYREQIRSAHPDAGGSHAKAAALNAAIARAREEMRDG